MTTITYTHIHLSPNSLTRHLLNHYTVNHSSNQLNIICFRLGGEGGGGNESYFTDR